MSNNNVKKEAGSLHHQLTTTAGGAHVSKMSQRLEELWRTQKQAMEQLNMGSKQDFKHHNDLPLARIKRIMKSDEDVRMISAEAPILFAKACELFILELTVRACCFSEHNKRNGLERDDICQVLQNTDIFDFLEAVVVNNGQLPPAKDPPAQKPAAVDVKPEPGPKQ